MITDTNLATRVLATIRRHGLLHGGETVLVAVSGGADSVALLDLLNELSPALRLSLHVAHVHHGLRSEAESDATFVARLCERLAVPYHLERVAVRRGPPWEGLEAEARRARYSGASRARPGPGRTPHRDGPHRRRSGRDRADAAAPGRGAARAGRHRARAGPGHPPIAGHAAARDRDAPARERGLGWVEDTTNRDPRFLRNRMRHEVLPFLGEVWGREVIASLCRSAAAARRWVVDLEQRARIELERLAGRGPLGFVFPVADLQALPEELAVRVLLLAASELGETRPLRGAAQRSLRRFLKPAAGRRSVRLGGLAVELSGRRLRVGPGRPAALCTRQWPVPGIPRPGRGRAPTRGALLGTGPRRLRPAAGGRSGRLRRRWAARDAALVRPRRSGDHFLPFGAAGERRLKSFLIDAAVPRWERPRVPLLEAPGARSCWVAGLRRGQAAPITAETRRILEVTLRRLP